MPKKRKVIKALLISLFICIGLMVLGNSSETLAYLNGQSADVAVGQTDTVSSNASTIQGGLSSPSKLWVYGKQLFIADSSNNRVLIYNTIPTSNGVNADVVLGQTSFTPSSTGTTSSTLNLSTEGGVSTDGTKVYVADQGNNRVLIWNSIPTTNGKAADIVIGQSSFTTSSSGCSQSKLSSPTKVFVYNNKMFIVDQGNSRVLIWNSIPTSSGVNADVVIGQSSFTSCSSGTTQSTLSSPAGAYATNSSLAIADSSNNRVLIWNSIPTSNGVNADVVLGQTSFTSSSAGSTSAASLSNPEDIFYDGLKFFVADQGNNRVLIWNSIPNSNNQGSAHVIGQTDIISNTSNTNGQGDDTLNDPRGIHVSGNQLFIADRGNNRILIYNNQLLNPVINAGVPYDVGDKFLGLDGEITLDDYYVVTSVEYSVNGGPYQGADPDPPGGSFYDRDVFFRFDFDPKSNGNNLDGYTLQLRAVNDNSDTTNWFYFQPFNLEKPDDNTAVTTSFPQFSFSINQRRDVMKNQVNKYQIWVKDGGLETSAYWRILIDNIPADFSLAQSSINNMQRQNYVNSDPNNGNGIYEDSQLTAQYDKNSSRITVSSKIAAVVGTFAWKAVAVDQSAHNIESSARVLRVDEQTSKVRSVGFPLAIAYVGGLGQVNISSSEPGSIKDSYFTTSTSPTFYGIAPTNAIVTLVYSEDSCSDENSQTCSGRYSAIANPDSRFGINLPPGALKTGASYTFNVSSNLADKYNELATFNLKVQESSSKDLESTKHSSNKTISSPSISPTPISSSLPNSQNNKTKHCFLWWCF